MSTYFEIRHNGGDDAHILFPVKEIDQLTKPDDFAGNVNQYGVQLFREALDELGNVKRLNIHLPFVLGGDATLTGGIYDALAAHPAEKTVFILVLAASSGSIIAMAGNRIIMAPEARYVIHFPHSVQTRPPKSVEEQNRWAEYHRLVTQGMIEAYRGKTGLPRQKIVEIMDRTTWLAAPEALRLGFCDEIRA